MTENENITAMDEDSKTIPTFQGCSFTRKGEGAEAGLRGLRGEKNAQSTIKTLRSAFFSPEFTHFSIQVEGAPDQVEGASAPQLNRILRP